MKERYRREVFKTRFQRWQDSLEDTLTVFIHSDWCPGDLRCWAARQYWLMRNSQ